MLVNTRFVVELADGDDFLRKARELVQELSQREGFLGARIGRAADDPRLWLMTTEWTTAGTWRRSLGGNEMKLMAIPLLSYAIDEVSVFERLYSLGPDGSALEAESLRIEQTEGR